MKKLLKKSIAGILVLVLCVGLLSTTAFAVEDNIVVIREDTTIEGDFTIDGELYIVEGAHLITTGDVTIYGEVYVFGSWRNTGAISGEGTIHCLHYNSMSFALDAAGHFSSTTNSGGRNPSLAVSVNNSYLDIPIPEGHTYDPETGETTDYEPGDEPDSEPDAGQPEDTTKPEPDDSPVVLSRTSSAASYIINAYDEDGNYYSSAISSVSLTESSVVLGSQTQILFGVAFAPSDGWEVEEVTFDGESLALEYDSDTGKYSTSVYYRGEDNPTLTMDIVLKWVGSEEAEPESDPDPEGTSDPEPDDSTKPAPDASPFAWSGSSSAATYIINACDEDGNYYSSAVSSASVSEASIVVGSQAQITFSLGITLADGWEMEEVTCNGKSTSFEYNSDTGKYNFSASYSGQSNPTITTDIVVKWVGIEEADPGSDSEPDGTTDSGTKSSPDSAGHIYDFDNIDWQWTSDYSAANAYVYCVDGDGAAKAYEAEIESYSNDYGGTTYVATIVDENGNTYSNTVVLGADGNPIDVEFGTGSSGTDSSGTDSSSTGSSGTASPTGTSGTSGTASTVSTASSGTGSTASTLSTSDTGSSGTDSAGSTSSTGNSTDTGSSGTGSTDTGSSGTASTGSTGSGYTGSSGSGYTGSSGSGYTGSSGSGYTGSSGSGYTDSSGSSTGTAAQTDDSAMPYVYLALALCAGAAVVTFSVRRRVTRG